MTDPWMNTWILFVVVCV